MTVMFKTTVTTTDMIAPFLFVSSAWLVVYWERRQKEQQEQAAKANGATAAAAAADNVSAQEHSKSLRVARYLSDHSEWSSYSEEEELFIQSFPKIELHVHLDGSFDPHFLYKYLREHPESVYSLPVETDLPWEPGSKLAVRSMVQKCKTDKQYHDLCTCRGYRSLKAMLNCFEIFLPLVRGNLDLIEQLALDFCQRQWEQHAIYTEVRYSPHLLAEGYKVGDKGEVDAKMVLKAVTRGLRRGSRQFGITVNQILCAMTWRPDWAMSTLDLVVEHQQDFPCATVGVDIAAGEEHFDKDNFPDLYKPHYEMIQRAKKLGIPITLHAGESTDLAKDNVERAVTDYGASRIGHGYSMVESPELMEFVSKTGCHIEVCPTSSVEAGGWRYETKNWEEHPCISMQRHGVPFSFSSDDPAVFHTSLAWQYRIAVAKMGLTQLEIVQTNLNAVDAAFCPQDVKDELRNELLRHARRSSRQSFRKSLSDTFADRVYLNAEEYI